MAKRTLVSLLAVTLLSMIWAVPRSSFAQDPTNCVPADNGGCLPTAPESELVDLAVPSFSDPTNVTNRLHPTSEVQSILMLGRVDRLPFRTEVTLLPETKPIEWNGQQIETLVSQYVAYLDGRITEVALDWYAQADDGSVWYFGEDVFNYEEGVVADTEGTWLAGKDGPAAMIMPGNPQVGDVYRPENIPGLVYEEVTVLATDETVVGPPGPVDGAMVVQELHQDGLYEEKVFAPGYGEFLTGQGGELEALALAVPTDELPGPPPAELETLTTGANAIFDAAGAEDWTAASDTLNAMTAAWDTYQAGEVPPLLDSQMSTALVYLVAAVDAHQPEETRQAAIEVARGGLDLQLRHRPVVEIDLGRFELFARQIQVDAASPAAAAVMGDVTVLEWIHDRIAHAFDPATAESVDALLAELRTAADGEDLSAATDAATRLRDLLAGVTLNATANADQAASGLRTLSSVASAPLAQEETGEDDDGEGTPVVGTPLLQPQIDVIRAQEIALTDQAGAAVLSVELEGEDGVLVYEVTLDNGTEVELDATSGDILGPETEQNDQANNGDDDANGDDEEENEEDDEDENQETGG